MLYASNREVSRTIGAGKEGVSDKILHGSDSRWYRDDSRSKPPTLQDVLFQSLKNELVRLTLVDQKEMIGRIVWYSSGKMCLSSHDTDASEILSCSRIHSLAPIDLDEDAIPFLTDSLRADLLACEERTSRLQIVRRRIRQRNSRIAAAARFSMST